MIFGIPWILFVFLIGFAMTLLGILDVLNGLREAIIAGFKLGPTEYDDDDPVP